MPEIDPEQAWREACSWKEHRRAQLREWAKAPFAQKLEWIEEICDLFRFMHDPRRERRAEERARRERPPEP